MLFTMLALGALAPLPTAAPHPILPVAPAVSAPSSQRPSAVRMSGVFIAAPPPGAADGALYLTLENGGSQPLRVMGGSTSLATAIVPMRQVTRGGLTTMQDTPAFVVPARGRLVLRPGGDHLMLSGLRRTPRAGEWVRVILRLEGQATLTLRVPVKRL